MDRATNPQQSSKPSTDTPWCSGFYHYATLSANGKDLVAIGVPVGRVAAPETLGPSRNIRIHRAVASAEAQASNDVLGGHVHEIVIVFRKSTGLKKRERRKGQDRLMSAIPKSALEGSNVSAAELTLSDGKHAIEEK